MVLKGRLDIVEEKISDFKGIEIKTIQSEANRERIF
jgi:hypothetical protein